MPRPHFLHTEALPSIVTPGHTSTGPWKSPSIGEEGRMFSSSDMGTQPSSREQWMTQILVLGKSEKSFMEPLSSALGLGEAVVSLSGSFPLTPRETNADLSYGSLPLSKEMLVGGSLPLFFAKRLSVQGGLFFLFIKPTLSLSLFHY